MKNMYMLVEATVDSDGNVNISSKLFAAKEKAEQAIIKKIQKQFDVGGYALTKAEYKEAQAEDPEECCEFHGKYYNFSRCTLSDYVHKRSGAVTFDNNEFASGYGFQTKTWKIIEI